MFITIMGEDTTTQEISLLEKNAPLSSKLFKTKTISWLQRPNTESAQGPHPVGTIIYGLGPLYSFTIMLQVCKEYLVFPFTIFFFIGFDFMIKVYEYLI